VFEIEGYALQDYDIIDPLGGVNERSLTFPPPGVLSKLFECVEMDIDECHALSSDSQGMTSDYLPMQYASGSTKYKSLTWTKMQVRSAMVAGPRLNSWHQHREIPPMV